MIPRYRYPRIAAIRHCALLFDRVLYASAASKIMQTVRESRDSRAEVSAEAL